MKRSGLLLAIALLALGPAIARADSSTVLSGHAYQITTHAPIAGADVVAASPQEVRRGRTDAQGRFVFLGLLPGLYTVSVIRDGYDVCYASRVVVTSGETDYLMAPLQAATRMLDGGTRAVAIRGGSSYVIY